MNAPLFQIDKVNKHFGGVMALTDVSLSIQPGEIYGLIGPNGAGKTALFQRDDGAVYPGLRALPARRPGVRSPPVCIRWPRPALRAPFRISACSMQ